MTWRFLLTTKNMMIEDEFHESILSSMAVLKAIDFLHKIHTSALRLVKLCWKASVSLCWSPGQHLNIFYSDLSPREPLASQPLVDVSRNSLGQTVLQWWNASEDSTRMLFNVSYVAHSRGWCCAVALCVFDNYLKLVPGAQNIKNIRVFYSKTIKNMPFSMMERT